MVIGLTGGYCAGKNEAAALLEKAGWACVDVDKLGHEAVELARDAIVDRFGPGIVGPDGKLDRRAIARIVFADPAALADQEAIVHPVANRLVGERLAAALAAAAGGREPRVCVNAALLHKAEAFAACEAILEVRAPFPLRALRGARRDGTSLAAALRRITRQRGFRAALRAAAGALAQGSRPRILALRNWGGRAALARAVARALRRIEAGGAARY
jgi:dephospho-CoA kinase